MEGMLSQHEINALLSGMDLSGDSGGSTESLAEETTNSENAEPKQESFLVGAEAVQEDTDLTDVEKDAIGEVANISMGSSATTLYSLVNRKVNITTPVVTLAKWSTLLEKYERPCVFIQIKYTMGLDGTNILVLKEHDVKVITDLMMGGDGTNTQGELGDLHLSAISEAMNQMMGSAATSLSTMLKTVIDISPPDSTLLDLTMHQSGETIATILGGTFVKIEFRMQIADLVDSTIMQLDPIDFAKKLVENFVNVQTESLNMGKVEAPVKEQENTQETIQGGSMDMNNSMEINNSMDTNSSMSMNQMDMNNQMGMNNMGMNQMGMNGMGMNQMGMNGMGMNNMGMNNMGMNSMGINSMMGGSSQMNNINIQPAQFQNFSGDIGVLGGQENIGIIMDVPLEVTVELGRTSKSIAEILNFAPGTIIELNRIAGEPIDVLVNGKFVAKGEVVVIEENFSIRVTEIIK